MTMDCRRSDPARFILKSSEHCALSLVSLLLSAEYYTTRLEEMARAEQRPSVPVIKKRKPATLRVAMINRPRPQCMRNCTFTHPHYERPAAPCRVHFAPVENVSTADQENRRTMEEEAEVEAMLDEKENKGIPVLDDQALSSGWAWSLFNLAAAKRQ